VTDAEKRGHSRYRASTQRRASKKVTVTITISGGIMYLPSHLDSYVNKEINN